MKSLVCARITCGRCEQREIELPESDDDFPTNNLNRSVGANAPNEAEDVETVQTQLNRIKPSSGGPITQLLIDGKCGPLTKSAILKFQQRHYTELLGDGKIEPGKATWRKLLDLSENSPDAYYGKSANASGKTAGSISEDTQVRFQQYLLSSTYRVNYSLRCIDKALAQLGLIKVM
jgi:peptidoglycan hydrolase-like protein with peptidoglycan-binding domain